MPPRSRRALILLAALTATALLLQTPLLSTVRSAAWSAWVGTIGRLWQLGPLAVEPSVADQLHQLTSENARLRAETKDYQALREQLGTPALPAWRTIPAAIIARPTDTFRVELVINQGAKDGVTLQAPVVAYGSTLVGFVSELFERTATVRLLLHPATNLAAEALAENSPRGLLVSRTYTSLALTTVPRDATLPSGTAVVTVARPGIPQGLYIGTVSSVRNEEDAAYQEASLNVAYDVDQLRAVTVLVEP